MPTPKKLALTALAIAAAATLLASAQQTQPASATPARHAYASNPADWHDEDWILIGAKGPVTLNTIAIHEGGIEIYDANGTQLGAAIATRSFETSGSCDRIYATSKYGGSVQLDFDIELDGPIHIRRTKYTARNTNFHVIYTQEPIATANVNERIR